MLTAEYAAPGGPLTLQRSIRHGQNAEIFHEIRLSALSARPCPVHCTGGPPGVGGEIRYHLLLYHCLRTLAPHCVQRKCKCRNARAARGVVTRLDGGADVLLVQRADVDRRAGRFDLLDAIAIGQMTPGPGFTMATFIRLCSRRL